MWVLVRKIRWHAIARAQRDMSARQLSTSDYRGVRCVICTYVILYIYTSCCVRVLFWWIWN